jgi:hypothetical protein
MVKSETGVALRDLPVRRRRQRPFSDTHKQFQPNRKRIVAEWLAINHARSRP